ncbi:MAG TPA: PQQ-binding-like beta-propeller repeat protein [Fimbriimonadaceae bacterium]|nr:PQQ-binding-like beta-propeller repeat protein [Fimbriimonadaceae bacterium]
MKRAIVGLAALAAFGAATADFDGPAPIAWRWADNITQRPNGAPVLLGDHVYTAVGSRMYCLDRTTGNLVWRYPIGEPLNANFNTGAVVADGIMVAAADDKSVYGVDVKTGEKVWHYIAANHVFAQPVVAGNFVVLATSDNQLMALNLKSGTEAWSQPYVPSAGIFQSLVSWQDNVMFLTSDGLLNSLDVTTQRPAWRPQRFTNIGPLSRLAVVNDLLYVTSGSYLTALSASTGRLRWEKIVPGELRFSAASNGDSVVCVTDSGRMFIFDRSGRPVTRTGVNLGSTPVASPSFAGKLVTIPTSNGAISLIDPQSGDIVWSFIVPPMIRGMTLKGTSTGVTGSGLTATTTEEDIEVKSVPAAGPTVSEGDTLLVMAQDGSILAFDKHLGVDKTPPVISMLWPNPGDQVSGRPPMEMVFKVTDDGSGVDIDSVQITINGEPYIPEIDRNGLYRVRVVSSGRTNQPLRDGRTSVIVSAKDWMGNSTAKSFVLTVDNNLPALGSPPTTKTGGSGGL